MVSHVLVIIINKPFLITENDNKVIKMYTFIQTHYYTVVFKIRIIYKY
jgi:hypothetical protein